MTLTFCFSVGNIEDAVNNATGQPYIQVVVTATNSYGGATAMSALMILLAFINTINSVASSSWQLYAFARDRGLPFSSFLSYVKPGRAIPLNSILVCFLVNCLLSLINIGSSVAYNAIVSLDAAAIITSYLTCISCILLKRYRREPLRPRRWSLGKWGAPVNVLALCFLSMVYFFSFWPLYRDVGFETFNWSVAIYVAVLIFAVPYYWVYGRKVYDGPVVMVKRDL